MPFLPLFIVIGIFLATSKILQPSQRDQRRSRESGYKDFDDKSLSLALIDYISRESKNTMDYDSGRKSTSEKRSKKKTRSR